MEPKYGVESSSLQVGASQELASQDFIGLHPHFTSDFQQELHYKGAMLCSEECFEVKLSFARELFTKILYYIQLLFLDAIASLVFTQESKLFPFLKHVRKMTTNEYYQTEKTLNCKNFNTGLVLDLILHVTPQSSSSRYAVRPFE